jgi:hypothetical protein
MRSNSPCTYSSRYAESSICRRLEISHGPAGPLAVATGPALFPKRDLYTLVPEGEERKPATSRATPKSCTKNPVFASLQCEMRKNNWTIGRNKHASPHSTPSRNAATISIRPPMINNPYPANKNIGVIVKLCLKLRSRDSYGWRGPCAAGAVIGVGVSSRALPDQS